MASLWKHVYFRESLMRSFEENFKDATDEESKNAQIDLTVLVDKLKGEERLREVEQRKCDNFETCLSVYTSVLQYIRLNTVTSDNKDKIKMAERFLDSLLKSSRHIFLSGEWIRLDVEKKNQVEIAINVLAEQLPSRKSELEGLLRLSQKPWNTEEIKKLINGKMETEGDVLALLSSEGVEGILLRIEMLVESSMDQQAYKVVAAVANSLLAEDMILQSYVSTSTPGTVDRLIDVFLALSAAMKKESRLFKVLKVLGLDEVNTIYMKRFAYYLNGKLPESKQKESDQTDTDVEMKPVEEKTEDKDKSESETKDKTESKEKDKSESEEKENTEKVKEPEVETKNKEEAKSKATVSSDTAEEEIDESRFKLLDKGRCERLFTEAVCLKTLEIIFQWSLAGAAVKETSDALQTYLLREWLDKCSRNKERLMEDVDILMESATQTTFLYNLAHQLFLRFGKEIEIKSISIFIRALTSDINEYEAAKRNKSSKHSVENKLTRGFWLLSKIVADRMSLCRECVLTAYSIQPNQEMLDKIREFAKIARLDTIEADDDEGEKNVDLEEGKDVNAGIHCRVTLGSDKATFQKAYHQSLKAKENALPMSDIFKMLSNPTDKRMDDVFSKLETQLAEKSFSVAPTKLRVNKPRDKKKVRNLEGLISIRGELVTEAANYNPMDIPCKSLQPEVLNLPSRLTDDLLIVISAARWHMLSWVMCWSELEQACIKLLKDPTLRDPIEDLKFLNIDYTQFNGWSSDEEVTIFTGIEKGYEEWLLESHERDARIEEEGVGISSDEEEEEKDRKIEWEDYNEPDKYIVPDEYTTLMDKEAASTEEPMETSDTDPESKKGEKEKKSKNVEDKKGGTQTTDKKETERETDAKETKGRKRKAPADSFPEKVEDEFFNENPDSPVAASSKVDTESMDTSVAGK